MNGFIQEHSLAAPIRPGLGGSGHGWEMLSPAGSRHPSPPPATLCQVRLACPQRQVRCAEPLVRTARQLIPCLSRAFRIPEWVPTPPSRLLSQMLLFSECRVWSLCRKSHTLSLGGLVTVLVSLAPLQTQGIWWGLGGGEGLQIHLLLNVPWGFHCTLKFENTTLCRLLCFTETERKFPSL